ncbi:MAG TPA: hypothetical protein VKT77_12730 [Chthonomonadaceae bacterium]|nr:hypothetical protein [Chthonomonadaceae bacterium]
MAPDATTVSARETYRLRVENARFGRIELSVDGGEHFLLVGRVLKPASLAAPDRAAKEPGVVVRSSADGIAFSIAPGQVLKLLPAPAHPTRAKVADCAIATDIRPAAAPFGDLGPAIGGAVLQQVGNAPWSHYPSGLTPTDETVFGFIVALPGLCADGASHAPPGPSVMAKLADARKRLTEQCARYAEGAASRATENGRSIVSGKVLLRAKVPEGEPEPITAVSYSINGDVVSMQNTLPSEYYWDTTRLPNGEYVVEIRGYSARASVVSRVRALVVVKNPPGSENPH